MAGRNPPSKRLGYLRPGVWLFILKFDGKEPAIYKKDSLGNASHVGIYTASKDAEVVHSSITRGGVAPTLLSKGWTHVGIPRDVHFPWWEDSHISTEPIRPEPLLKLWDKGPPVKALQQQLSILGYSLGAAGLDGILGPDTQRAVKAFQRDEGLVIDGLVGPHTRAKLIKALDLVSKRPLEEISKASPRGRATFEGIKEQDYELIRLYILNLDIGLTSTSFIEDENSL